MNTKKLFFALKAFDHYKETVDPDANYDDFIYEFMFEKAEKILETFIKNNDSREQAIERIASPVYGELNEFTAKGLDGYMAYGNREALFYIDDIEEPFVLYIDIYGGRKSMVWG
jgi:hypothetical protein